MEASWQCIICCSVFMFILDSVLSRDDLEIIVEHKPETCDDFASIGDMVHVDYTGMLTDGRIFDTSMQEGRQPLKFQLGAGTLIKGWERGVQGMCVGERRKLIIPPHLGYGNKGIEGVIPPDSKLIFSVNLVSMERQLLSATIYKFASFAFWPAGVLALLYYLYKKAVQSNDTVHDRRNEKRLGKKKK